MSYQITLSFLLVLSFAGSFFGIRDEQQQKTERDRKPLLSKEDQLRIQVQKICPVTGKNLNLIAPESVSKVNVGGQTIFLCCQECQQQQIDKTHWKTIQDRIASAQGKCPIMEKTIDRSMESTNVNGVPIYVCCPPCISKIEADQETILKSVFECYRVFIEIELETKSNHSLRLAQGICPVTGQPLEENSALTKVEVGKEHLLLCCPDCAKQKINPSHYQTIQKNLAKSQEICPVMNQPIDETMESVVIEGRRIFVCCPPCIKKIEASPQRFIHQLNEKIIGQDNSN